MHSCAGENQFRRYATFIFTALIARHQSSDQPSALAQQRFCAYQLVEELVAARRLARAAVWLALLAVGVPHHGRGERDGHGTGE